MVVWTNWKYSIYTEKSTPYHTGPAKITIISVMNKSGQKFVFLNETPCILFDELKDEGKYFKMTYHVPIPKSSSFLNKADNITYQKINTQ